MSKRPGALVRVIAEQKRMAHAVRPVLLSECHPASMPPIRCSSCEDAWAREIEAEFAKFRNDAFASIDSLKEERDELLWWKRAQVRKGKVKR